jgi:xylulokinase
MAVLGIDVGTGGTRALVIDEAGHILGSGTADHQPFASPQPGWAEQDPRDWWQASVQAIRQAIHVSGLSAHAISCVGFSGQMHGAVVLDKNHEVVRPALIWCDQRTEVQSRQLARMFGVDRLIHLTCNPPLTNFTLTKLLWLQQNEPENWERVRYVMLPKDYVRFRLTGESATDVADASGTLLLNVARRTWSNEVLSKTNIDNRLLPQLFESQDICGGISQEASVVTDLKAGTPVIAGAGDQAAGAVGIGITKAGIVSATIGTSGVVFAATDHPAMDPKGRLHSFCHAIPQRWHVMGVTQAAGLSLRWFRDRLGVSLDDERNSYEVLTEEAATVPAGSGGVFWAPYLMGERTPHLDPNARAAFLGLSASHGRAHLARAILEGVAYSLKDTFAIFDDIRVPVQHIRLGGGGARSPLWRQIQADVYGRELELVEAEEGAAFGAAILAGVGVKWWTNVDEACEAVVRIASRVKPDPTNSAKMLAGYQTYRRIYPALRSVFDASNASPAS